MKVVFVVGTTASGKSDAALEWAQKYSGVIVNCDSVQVYKGLDIGSAKPSLAERSICPHYLYDYVSAPAVMTAGVYRDDFFKALKEIESAHGKETPIFVVGGTGFYFLALEKGMYDTPEVPTSIRDQVADEMSVEGGASRLYTEIVNYDSQAAEKIKPQDSYRIARAVELLRTLRASSNLAHLNITSLKDEFESQRLPFPYPLLKVGPQWDREVLRSRISVRVDKMLQSGLIDEVKSLVAQGLADWSPLESVGYKETLEFLDSNQTKEWLREQIVIHTHQLAKRQRTWFQRDKDIHWYSGAEGAGPASKLIEDFLRK